TAPEQVNAVVLLDPSGFPVEGKSLPLAFRLARTPLVNQTLSLFTPRRLFQTSLEEVYADDSLVTPALVDRYWELTLHAGNRQAFVDRANQQEDQPTHLLRTIAAPVLVLWGAEDTWIPVEHAQKFSAMLPNATTLIYPDLGHVPMEEAPLRTAEDVRRFLQEYSNATDHAGH
ncbi:MAG: alpha/beta hydrolase, partial [Pseudomonadota bacterium]